MHWEDIKDSARFADIMVDVARGVYPHAGGMLAEIMGFAKTASPSSDDEQSVAASTTSTATVQSAKTASTTTANTPDTSPTQTPAAQK